MEEEIEFTVKVRLTEGPDGKKRIESVHVSNSSYYSCEWGDGMDPKVSEIVEDIGYL